MQQLVLALLYVSCEQGYSGGTIQHGTEKSKPARDLFTCKGHTPDRVYGLTDRGRQLAIQLASVQTLDNNVQYVINMVQKQAQGTGTGAAQPPTAAQGTAAVQAQAAAPPATPASGALQPLAVTQAVASVTQPSPATPGTHVRSHATKRRRGEVIDLAEDDSDDSDDDG